MRKTRSRTTTAAGPALTARSAHELLAPLLRYNRRARAGHRLGRHVAIIAALGYAELTRNLMTWVASEVGLLHSPEKYSKLSPQEKRFILIIYASLQLPILQDELFKEFCDGLAALNATQTEPLFMKTGARRGAIRHLIAEAEFRLLIWIRYQHGLGRKVIDAEEEVGEAIGCSRDTIHNWLKELIKVYGAQHVHSRLYGAQMIGELEARSGPGALPWPWSSDQGHALAMQSLGLERDLQSIAASRHAAQRGVRPAAPAKSRPVLDALIGVPRSDLEATPDKKGGKSC